MEDALPLWLAEILGPSEFERAYHQTDATYHEANVMRVRVKRACRQCNGGWMSELEGNAKPLILQLMQGRPTVINQASDKQTLSCWALKTLMMLEFAKPERESLIPRAHHEFLRDYGRPPQQVSIWIGALPKPEYRSRVRRFWERTSYWIGPLPAVNQIKLYLGAITVDELVFRIEGFMGDDVERRYVDAPGRPKLQDIALRIWPLSEEAIEWPPLIYETQDSLDTFLDHP